MTTRYKFLSTVYTEEVCDQSTDPQTCSVTNMVAVDCCTPPHDAYDINNHPFLMIHEPLRREIVRWIYNTENIQQSSRTISCEHGEKTFAHGNC